MHAQQFQHSSVQQYGVDLPEWLPAYPFKALSVLYQYLLSSSAQSIFFFLLPQVLLLNKYHIPKQSQHLLLKNLTCNTNIPTGLILKLPVNLN